MVKKPVNVHTVPLHIGDLMTGTMDMDVTEFGAYMSLLIAHYQAGKTGLIYDDKRLARMAKCSLKVWKRIKPALMNKFEIYEKQKHTKIVHHRVVEELQRMEEKSTQNSANAMKRWKTANANAEKRDKNSTTTQNHNPEYKKPLNTPPIPPLNVYRVENYLTDDAWHDARSHAPGWDIKHLARKYDEGINSGEREKPRCPNKAFPMWCKSYTKGKNP